MTPRPYRRSQRGAFVLLILIPISVILTIYVWVFVSSIILGAIVWVGDQYDAFTNYLDAEPIEVPIQELVCSVAPPPKCAPNKDATCASRPHFIPATFRLRFDREQFYPKYETEVIANLTYTSEDIFYFPKGTYQSDEQVSVHTIAIASENIFEGPTVTEFLPLQDTSNRYYLGPDAVKGSRWEITPHQSWSGGAWIGNSFEHISTCREDTSAAPDASGWDEIDLLLVDVGDGQKTWRFEEKEISNSTDRHIRRVLQKAGQKNLGRDGYGFLHGNIRQVTPPMARILDAYIDGHQKLLNSGRARYPLRTSTMGFEIEFSITHDKVSNFTAIQHAIVEQISKPSQDSQYFGYINWGRIERSGNENERAKFQTLKQFLDPPNIGFHFWVKRGPSRNHLENHFYTFGQAYVRARLAGRHAFLADTQHGSELWVMPDVPEDVLDQYLGPTWLHMQRTLPLAEITDGVSMKFNWIQLI